jgi:hypothetical protein
MREKNVVSLFKVKQQKMQQDEERIYNDIYFDVYIPFDEIEYWKSLTDFGLKYAQKMFEKTKNSVYKQFQQVLDQLSVDLEMYKEFGYTLEKFRFLFSFFETFTLYKILGVYQEQNKEYSKENKYYYDKLKFHVNQDKAALHSLEWKMHG